MAGFKTRNLPARLGATLTAAAAATAVAVSPGLAQATDSSAGSSTASAAARHCAVLVGPSNDGRPSPVLAQACDDTSAATARARTLQAAAKAGRNANTTPRLATVLMTLYSDTNYRGTSHQVLGSAGTCDRAGYRIGLAQWQLSPWMYILSSIKRAGACNKARVTNRASTHSESFDLSVPYLGSLLNDNVGVIWVYNRA
ncbi:hypothetical protein [Actinomadura sp. 9N407]|uniref:hypothetical protein n=1 Tax=Actinomadura sp. 9N407 TaxID=3375154 RepID=UPI0037B4BF09